MDPNQDTHNQPEQPRSPADTATGTGRESSALSERVPPAVIAAVVTGVFMLIASLASSYFPNKVKLHELSIGATQTAESRAATTTQEAADGTVVLTPGITVSQPSSSQGASPEATLMLPAKATDELPTRQPPTATPVIAPTDTIAAPETSVPSPQVTNTAAAAPTDTPTLAATTTLTVAPSSTPVPPTDAPTLEATTTPTVVPSSTPEPTYAPSATPAATSTPTPTGTSAPAS
jgi:hypothetical protein